MTTITIHDLQQETHDELASRAARSGCSLQEYLRATLIDLARRPDHEPSAAQVRHREWATGNRVPAQEILEHRTADRQ